jgi:hypothetical protein
MSTLLQEASAVLRALHELTVGFSKASPPDPVSVLGYQSKIVDLHHRLGQEMSKAFGSKETRYLNRKIEEAKQYRQGRIEFKLTAADATRDSLLAVGEEFQLEIDTAQIYESYRTMLQSLDRAFTHTCQVVNFLSRSESRHV